MSIQPTIPSLWRFLSTAQVLNASQLASLNAEPDELTASENQQRFQLAATLAFAGAAKAALTISIDGLIDTFLPAVFIITGNGVTVTLTASLTPSFNEFFSNNGFTQYDRFLIAQAITFELQNNLAFANLYSIRAENTTIIIEALDFGSIYNLTATLPLNSSIVSNTAGQFKYSYNTVLDYSAFSEFYVGSGVYGETVDKLDFFQVADINSSFAGSDTIQFSTSGATKNYVDLVFPIKKTNQSFSVAQLDDIAIMAGLPPILRPYFVLYGDSFRYSTNGERKRQIMGCSSIRWVQNAAQHKLDGYKLSNYVWNPNSTDSFSFLTARPDYLPVTYTSHQFLQMILKRTPQAKGHFWLDVDTKFYDGTNLVTRYGGVNGQTLVGKYGNISIDVSPDTLGLSTIESNEGKLIDSYSITIVWVTSPSGTIEYSSYPAKYTFLRRCNDQSLNLVWFNKLGAWDSLEFNGTQSKAFTRSTNEVNRALPFEANLRIGSTINSLATDDEIILQYNTNSNTITSVESGLIARTHYDWLQSILDSPSIITFDREQRRFRAVIITNYDYLWNTDQSEFNLRVEFKYTVDNNTISR